MRLMRLILLSMIALAACGPPLPPPRPLGSSSAQPGDNLECRDERTTGTNMSRSVCLTRDQIDENRKAAQDWEKRPRSEPTQTR